MLNSFPHLTKKSQDDTLKKIQDGSSNPEIASLRSQRRGWGLNSSFSRHSDILTIFLLRDPLPFTVARDFPPPHREGFPLPSLRGTSPSPLQATLPLVITRQFPSGHCEAASSASLRGNFLRLIPRPFFSRHRKAPFPSPLQATLPLVLTWQFPSGHCEAASSASLRGLPPFVIARHEVPKQSQVSPKQSQVWTGNGIDILSHTTAFPGVKNKAPSRRGQSREEISNRLESVFKMRG